MAILPLLQWQRNWINCISNGDFHNANIRYLFYWLSYYICITGEKPYNYGQYYISYPSRIVCHISIDLLFGCFLIDIQFGVLIWILDVDAMRCVAVVNSATIVAFGADASVELFRHWSDKRTSPIPAQFIRSLNAIADELHKPVLHTKPDSM